MQQLAPSPSQRGCPFHGLVSLWDMYKLHGRVLILADRSFTDVLTNVERMKAGEDWSQARMQAVSPESIDLIIECVNILKPYLETLGCKLTIKAIERLKKETDIAPSITVERCDALVAEISSRFNDEMEENFIFCTTSEIARYWGRDDHVSEAVRTEFPESAQELRMAGSAYCASLATASVFHSMRAAESGLRQVADDLGVTVNDTDGMKIVVDGIRTAANKIDQEPKAPHKQRRSQHYSEIAIEAGLFKDAWRNHVAHAKVNYQAEQALQILQATCRFFEKIVQPI